MEITSLPVTAAEIARQRLEACLKEKLKDYWDDLCAWEFYTFLLEQAMNHNVDTSGYASSAYQADHKQAMENCKKKHSYDGGIRIDDFLCD
jgi:hypothetical protein